MEVSIRDTYWIQDPSRLKSYHPCHQEKSIYFKHHIVWDTINGWQMRLTNPFCWALLTTGFGTRIDNTINSTNSDAMRNAQDISISNQMTFNSDDEAAWVAKWLLDMRRILVRSNMRCICRCKQAQGVLIRRSYDVESRSIGAGRGSYATASAVMVVLVWN